MHSCDTAKLLEPPKIQDTKVGYENPNWLREKLRYGNNSWNRSCTNATENGQSAAKPLRPICKDMGKVQRLNDGAGDRIQQILNDPVRYSLAPGAYPINRPKGWVLSELNNYNSLVMNLPALVPTRSSSTSTTP